MTQTASIEDARLRRDRWVAEVATWLKLAGLGEQEAEQHAHQVSRSWSNTRSVTAARDLLEQLGRPADIWAESEDTSTTYRLENMPLDLIEPDSPAALFNDHSPGKG